MPSHVIVEKLVGETPLQALEKYRLGAHIDAAVPMTYAGRLDPMASGKLLLLIGEECKKKDVYTKLDKEYEFEILLGIETDTGDVLGIPSYCGLGDVNVREVLESFVGEHTFPYPVYSSKHVEGKALFQHSHDGTLDDIQIPETTTRVHSIEYLSKFEVNSGDLLAHVSEKIGLLSVIGDSESLGSDFRKPIILEAWRGLSIAQKQFTILKCRAHVGAGTYIRTLAPAIAKKLGTCGLAYSIHRTKIGDL